MKISDSKKIITTCFTTAEAPHPSAHMPRAKYSAAYRNGRIAIGVVADGTKNGRNHRGNLGAKYAAKVIEKSLFDFSRKYPSFDSITEDITKVADGLKWKICSEWRKKVQNHISKVYFTFDELAHMGVSLLTFSAFDYVKAYGTAASAVLLCESYYVTVHIGTGSIVKISEGEEPRILTGDTVPPNRMETLGSIYELDSMTVTVTPVPENTHAAFAVSTDVMRNSFENDSLFLEAVKNHIEHFTSDEYSAKGYVASQLRELAHHNPNKDDLSAAYVYLP